MNMRFKHPRQKDNGHLEWVRQLPCLICQDDTTVEAAHVRFSDRSAAKGMSGMQQKPDDAFAVPLCGKHHREQHAGNERAWWQSNGIDPIKIGLALWYRHGDADACAMICANAKVTGD